MSFRTTTRVSITTLAALTTVSLYSSVIGNHKPAPAQIAVDSIGKDTILVGRLKKPIGTLMMMRGKWSYPDERAKDYSLRFTVSHVDDRVLDQPLEFNVNQIDVFTKQGDNALPPYEQHKQLVGVEWTLSAYETGTIEMTPGDFWKGSQPRAAPYYFRPFTSKVRGVLQR